MQFTPRKSNASDSGLNASTVEASQAKDLATAQTSTTDDYTLLEYACGYGRELFISNILSYLSRCYPDVVKDAFNKVDLPAGFEKTERELQHTDLTFIDNHGNKLLIIENKCGDTASRDQLVRYSEKLDDDNIRRTLISPLKTDKYVAEAAGWEYISYGCLAYALKDSFKKHQSNKDSLEYRFIIKVLDYMTAVNHENDTAINSISSYTEVGDLTRRICPRLMCVEDNKKAMRRRKLAYAAIVEKLATKLAANNCRSFAALGKGIRGEPIAEIFPKKVGRGNCVEFKCMFQNDCLAIGFCSGEGNPVKIRKKVLRQTRLTNFWKSIDGETLMRNIITQADTVSFPELNCIDLKNIHYGFIAKSYTISMIHIDIPPSMTVERLTDLMVTLAKNAETN